MRDQIIEAATKLFAEKGFVETSLTDIMSELGITGAAYYYYFDSKEAVLLEILERMAERVEQNLAFLREDAQSSAERLSALIASHAREAAANAAAATVLFANLGRNRSSEFRSIRRRMRVYTDELVAFYTAGVESGEFRDVDPMLTIFALIGMANWVAEWFDPRRHAAPDKIAEVIGELTRAAVTPRSS